MYLSVNILYTLHRDSLFLVLVSIFININVSVKIIDDVPRLRVFCGMYLSSIKISKV